MPFIGISPAELRGRSIRELFSVELIAHLEKNAAAAEAAGLTVTVTADPYTVDGLVAAVVAHTGR